MKLLLDMNLSPLWLATLSHAGFEVIHWSAVGVADAPDYEIMLFAQEQDYTICTQDLDFGLMLAASGNGKPSVVQTRSQDVLPNGIGCGWWRALPIRLLAGVRNEVLALEE